MVGNNHYTGEPKGAATERVIANRLDQIDPPKNTPSAATEPLEGALVALDPRTGEVMALVGGRDFHKSPFNRAIQAQRQPGSAFKPLLFAAAIEQGYSPSSLVTRSGICSAFCTK